MTQAKFHKVPSTSTPGVEYTVVERPDGTWSCSCPAHAFKNRDCKHIKQIRDHQPPEPPKEPKSAPQESPKPQYRNASYPERKQKLTIADIQERLKQMGKKAPKEDEFEKDVRKYVCREDCD